MLTSVQWHRILWWSRSRLLSAADVSSDLAADTQLDQAGWKTVTGVQAEAFSCLDQDHGCSTAWRNTVLDRKPDARIEASDVMASSSGTGCASSRRTAPDPP